MDHEFPTLLLEDGGVTVRIRNRNMHRRRAPVWKDRGPPLFSPHLIDDHSPFVASVHAFDLDGDGELEIVGAAMADISIHYWKRDDGNPDSWVKHVISSQFYGANSVYASDLDSDGDLDVIGAAIDAGEVAWWRNDGGSPISWFQQRIATIPGASPLTIVDVDGDGDNDVVTAGWHEVRWYRNEGRMTRVRPSGGRVRPWRRAHQTGATVRIVALSTLGHRPRSP
jgi:hypothetical protein